MKKYRIGIQCGSLGERCGIYTYSMRLERYLNKMKEDKNGEKVDVEAYLFNERAKKKTDLINVQYEPGLMQPQKFQNLINRYVVEPIVITVHHIGYLPSFYNAVDGFIFHSEDQVQNKPMDYATIQHPCLVYEDKDKTKLRKKYGLPLDKKILGTAGFIVGTGKKLPYTVREMLKRMNHDEFLYLTTSFWKAGDLGNKYDIMKAVEESGKEKQFRIDTDFVSDETLNEKLQCCDLLWTWCAVGPNEKGSQSGIAADMYGTRRKLIVKDSAHYSYIGIQPKVEVGRVKPDDFASDTLSLLRNGDLNDVQDPSWLSWEEKVKDYLDYFQLMLGE